MLDVGVKMPIQVIAPFFVAIGERNWNKFCELEKDFVAQYGI